MHRWTCRRVEHANVNQHAGNVDRFGVSLRLLICADQSRRGRDEARDPGGLTRTAPDIDAF
ncbi:MAG: hypothetical protein DMF94_19140 [Acidobacteria bacterium]|nr:MAG: hypothetical protein DMF94_19140 [Acidobacteriota bacterium]